jgi:hypothetical protein
MPWPTFDRFKSSLSHILTGFAPFAIGSLLFGSLWVGVFAVLCVYWSREKTQYQMSIKGNKSTFTVWNKGWSPLEWEFVSQLDLYVPVVFYSFVALVF